MIAHRGILDKDIRFISKSFRLRDKANHLRESIDEERKQKDVNQTKDKKKAAPKMGLPNVEHGLRIRSIDRLSMFPEIVDNPPGSLFAGMDGRDHQRLALGHVPS